MSPSESASVATHPEVIVVLGGGVLPDGTPAPATTARGTTAADLARAHPEATVICAGSHGGAGSCGAARRRRWPM